MCSARPLIVLYICVKFRELISNGFQLAERACVHGRNGYVQCSEAITPKGGRPELRFMCPARRLIVIYIGENILDGITVMERTRMMEALISDSITIPSPLFVAGHKNIALATTKTRDSY